MENDNKESNFFLKEFEFSSLTNITKVPGSNNLCRIYDAILEPDDSKVNNDESSIAEESRKVFLVSFKIFENSEKILEKLKKSMEISEKQINLDPELKHFYLTRCGFAQNKANQTFYLIYLNNGNKLINLENFHKKNKKNKHKQMRLNYFSQFLNFATRLHENKMRLTILNPNMIFHSKIAGYQLFGYFYYEFFRDYDFVENFPLAIFFGYFDPGIFNKIKDDESLQYKADIILLALLLAFLFSYDSSKSEEDLIFTSYGKMIFLLHGDYISRNPNFPRFMSIVADNEIREFLQKIIKLDYKEIPDLSYFRETFNKIVEKNLVSIKCNECGKNSSKQANKLNFLCKEFLCNDCFQNHECYIIRQIILRRAFQKFNLDKMYFENLTKSFDEIPNIADQIFEFYFNKELKNKFLRIENEHQRIERYTKMQENKINTMIKYVEKCLNEKITKIEEEISSLKDEIIKNYKNTSMNENDDFDDNKIFYEKSPGGLIDNPMILKIVKSNNKSNNKFQKFEEKLRDLQNLLDISKESKKSLNFNIKFNSAMDTLKYKSQIYLDQIKTEFLKNFDNTVNKYMNDLNDLYEKAELSKYNKLYKNFDNAEKEIEEEDKGTSENDIYQLHSIKENRNVATVDIKQNIIIIINHMDKDDQKFKPEFPSDYSPEPKNILQQCRWVNVKNRLFITGGVYRDKEGKDSNSKKALFADFYNSLTSPKLDCPSEIKIRSVKEMHDGRDQHCLLYANDYYIIAISGFRTKTCEQYNILKDDWTKLDPLDIQLYNTSAVLFNSINIYLFFGLISDYPKNNLVLNFSHEIYRLKLFSSEKVNSRWEKISYNFKDKIYLCLNALLNVNEKDIYIIGGRNQGENNFSNLTFCFDTFTTNIIENNVKLVKKLCFLESNFVKIPSDKEYALYSSDFHFVKFKI